MLLLSSLFLFWLTQHTSETFCRKWYLLNAFNNSYLDVWKEGNKTTNNNEDKTSSKVLYIAVNKARPQRWLSWWVGDRVDLAGLDLSSLTKFPLMKLWLSHLKLFVTYLVCICVLKIIASLILPFLHRSPPFFFLSNWQLFFTVVLHLKYEGNKIMGVEVWKVEQVEEEAEAPSGTLSLLAGMLPVLFLPLKHQLRKLQFFLMLLPALPPALLPQGGVPYFQKTENLWGLQAFSRSSFWNPFFSYPRIGKAQCLGLPNFATGFTKVLQRSCMLVIQHGRSTDGKLFSSFQSGAAFAARFGVCQ